MLRLMSSVFRSGNQMNLLSKISNGAMTTSARHKVIAVQENADAKAKAEALKALREVVAVIGRNPTSVSTGPVFNDEWVEMQVKFFSRPDIDSWEIRSGIHRLAEVDCVPEPVIIIAVLKACRRLNDYPLAIRFQEFVRAKCGDKVTTFWPYIMQEVKPTMDELGIDTLEALGYDQPELAVVDVDDIH